jgi:hypothetical protein
MSKTAYSFKGVFLFFTSFLSIGILFYSASIRHYIDCRSDLIYEDADVKNHGVMAFRYSLMSIVADAQFIDSEVQKRTLLVDKLKDKLIIISQIRFSINDIPLNIESYENTLIKSFSVHENMVGSRLLKANIQCQSIPKWFEFITPLMLLLILNLYLAVRYFRTQKSSNS